MGVIYSHACKKQSSNNDAGEPIEIDYGWFKQSVEGKLEHWGIQFSPASLKGKNAEQLPSAVKGYPNQVLYRKKQKITSP